jgi:hypothetical protein
VLFGKALAPKSHSRIDRLESERLTRGQLKTDAVLGNLRYIEWSLRRSPELRSQKGGW